MKWLLKICAKVVLSRLPVPYAAWRSVGLFRHGRMDSVGYALKIFELHSGRAYPDRNLTGKAILEVGPGDSLASAVIGRTHGAQRIILVDAKRFANADMALYRELAAQLADAGLKPPRLDGVDSLEGMLAACNAEYLTDGVDSLSRVPSGSVDFIWSHSVLEHIPKAELPRLMTEFRRILRPGGLMSHNIDFQDHLDHSLNNLRFSELMWEAPLLRDAGFYTNRIRAGEMHALVRSVGFKVLEEGFGRWPSMPLPRKALAPQFRALDEDELLIRTSHLIAQAAPAGASGSGRGREPARTEPI